MTSITPRSAFFALFAAGAAVSASGCVESVSGLDCRAVNNVTASTRADTVITDNGLKYRDLTVGAGAQVQSVAECQDVTLRYSGRLTNGTVFSATRSDPFTIGAGGLIVGFEQGVVGMKVGGTRQLIIPPSLGYGSTPRTDGNGNVIIPANSTLVFDIELVSIN
jgi:FKBP-type peptidyl-prolyl cis-trans isomerase